MFPGKLADLYPPFFPFLIKVLLINYHSQVNPDSE